ncbi:glycosyltransferase family 25 protein [Edwardsiella anguillarum]|uniref:glycosyltransferase family 25 protein n=1 Tax=Edwardsiella anguillarum TaxID=1821960 RepID=UPI0024B6FFE2|nr:glycosyltransferase family 25 protein [Edwardsiella anguillarum]WHP79154.1 glycosyltransferase family 25 protein [Edwardsiella anguillarum]WHQ16612.1 glycosyltransferase family 25 protein [Edwardsiella anguillarum]WHQ20147.1 glycosyltransferase family 25 protein [Edwardsiella anguillarum]WHQ23669.1 glycosyltransferase family 25 protein [Edwardsiella anguillarum]WHQ27239.1 glycosyltransferase family 25 protein [Edwardsiella anguillarum]
MRVFIINLKSDIQKKNEIIQQCKRLKIKFEIIDAVCGINLTDSDLDSLINTDARYYLSRGEMGCALSHNALYRRIIAEQLPFALILEDDAILHNDTAHVIALIEKRISKEDNIALLLYKTKFIYKNKMIALSDDYIFYESNAPTLTHGYVITNKAARTLLTLNAPVRVEADAWRYFYFSRFVRTYSLNTDLILSHDVDKQTSTIEKERRLKSDAQKQKRKSLDSKKSVIKIYHRLIRRIFLKKVKG